MIYIEGIVIAVPTASKKRFIAHAWTLDGWLIDQGVSIALPSVKED